MNILTIDDELLARAETKRQIIDLMPNASVFEAETPTEARRILLNKYIDCILLDLEMPGENGMDFLPDLFTMGIPVIVVSGHEQYAHRTYEYAVVDYLLKPVELSRLAIALKRIQKKRATSEREHDIVLFNDQKQCWPVQIQNVVLAEATGSYVNVHTKDGNTITLSKQLKEIGEILNGSTFIRANRSQIVNIQCLQSIQKLSNGKMAAQLNGHGKILFSRRQAAAFRTQFGF